MPLPRDATIATVVDLLSKPEHYVPTVFGQINKVRTDPNARVRIGITGDGMFPNYRIEHSGGLNGPFSGRDHTEISPLGERDDRWSQLAMTFDQVVALLTELRGRR